MPPQSSVFAYELTTRSEATTRASVEAISLAILDNYPDAPLHVWIVAVTTDQALLFRLHPWIITPRQLGPMLPTADRESLWYHDLSNNQTYEVSVEALNW